MCYKCIIEKEIEKLQFRNNSNKDDQTTEYLDTLMQLIDLARRLLHFGCEKAAQLKQERLNVDDDRDERPTELHEPLDYKRFEVHITEGMDRMLTRAEEDHGFKCGDIIGEFFSSGAANGVDLDVILEIGVHSRVYKLLTDYAAEKNQDLNTVCLEIFRWFLLDW